MAPQVGDAGEEEGEGGREHDTPLTIMEVGAKLTVPAAAVRIPPTLTGTPGTRGMATVPYSV